VTDSDLLKLFDVNGHSMTRRPFELSVKTVVVGNSGVGKTSILFRFVNQTFNADVPSTLGVEFMSKVIDTQSRTLEIQLWDTAGQELFRAVTRGYYRGAIGAFVVFDLTKRESFISLSQWISDLQSIARRDVVLVILGNKADLVDARDVTKFEAEEFAKRNNAAYFETSAKTGDNIEPAILRCVQGIERLIDTGVYDAKTGSDNYVLTDDGPGNRQSSDCC
jgi:small GTP-binding protein